MNKLRAEVPNECIKQITVEDARAADRLFNDLMGTAVVPRKEYVKKHSAEAMFDGE